MHQSTAILFFSRTAKVESLSKPFVTANKQQDVLIKELLIKKTLSVINKTGIPYFFFDEHLQTGNSFGERLSGAMQYIFSEGFENIIAIGNDCPLLKTKHIINAEKLLGTHPMVLGKDNHGGAYLIGISKSVFEQEKFCALRWQSKFLFGDLLDFSPHAILSELLFDINNKKDAVCIKKFLSFRSVLIRLLDFKSKMIIQFSKSNNHDSPFISHYFSLRAPPVSF